MSNARYMADSRQSPTAFDISAYLPGSVPQRDPINFGEVVRIQRPVSGSGIGAHLRGGRRSCDHG